MYFHTSCNALNGALAIEVAPNNNAQVSLNNMPFSENLDHDNLPAGTYDIKIEDENGCQLDTVLIIDPSLPPPIIDEVLINNDNCINGEGSLEVMASGGEGNLSFSINGSPDQNDSNFLELTSGDYTVMG